jgi:hypothetical protein
MKRLYILVAKEMNREKVFADDNANEVVNQMA